MSTETGIAWTDHTFNPWWGCEKISPGCKNCYAAAWDARFGGEHWGAQAPRRFFGAAHWNEPVKWNRAAKAAGRRARVFCASMADVFEDRRDLDDERDALWDLIACTPHLDWQLLTKRPENMDRMLPWGEHGASPLPWRNVWLGTTVEDQEHADTRIEHLMRTTAAVRFLSCEPLLEPVKLSPWFTPIRIALLGGRIDWVIGGGESGGGARPMEDAWALSLKAQCEAAGVAFFMKQRGGVKDKRDDPEEWPVELRVRQFPPEAAP